MGVEDVIHFISEGVREKVKEAKAEQKKETTGELIISPILVFSQKVLNGSL